MKVCELLSYLSGINPDRHIMIQIGDGDRSELEGVQSAEKNSRQYFGRDENIVVLILTLGD